MLAPFSLRTVSLCLLTLVLAATLCMPAIAQNEPWIPPRSPDFDRLAREIEEAKLDPDSLELKPALTKLADRIFDGDPGGCFPIGDGYHVGAGPYLQLVLQSLPQEIAEEIRSELKLSLRSRFEEPPPPGFDPTVDRRRTRQLLDLSADLIGTEWIDALGHSALERGDFGHFQLLKANSDSPWGSFLPSSQRLATLSDINLTKTHPILLEEEPNLTDNDSTPAIEPWQKQHAISRVLSSGTHLWIQSGSEISSRNQDTGDLLWKSDLLLEEDQSAAEIGFQNRRPALSTDVLAVSSTNALQGYDSLSGQSLWKIGYEQIIGAPSGKMRWCHLSEPIAVPGGFVVVTQRYTQNRVEAFISRIERNGKVSWVRSLGESTGATWLALQSWSGTPIYRQGRIFWNSGRGTVMAVREMDGAILWARELQPEGPVGLKDQLQFNSPDRSQLEYRQGQLFHHVPGSARLSRISATDGQILNGLPLPEGALWCISKTGQRCVIVTAEGVIHSWMISSLRNGRPRMEWQHRWPADKLPTPIAITMLESGNSLIATSEVLSVINPAGRWVSHTAWVTPPQSIQFCRDGIAVQTASSLEWWSDQYQQLTPERGFWDSANLSQLMEHNFDFSLLTGLVSELNGRSPHNLRSRNQLRWILDRNDLDLPTNVRKSAEVSLISAENSSRLRLRVAWERALGAWNRKEFETADTICQLMLAEPGSLLRDFQVALEGGRTVNAEAAFSGLLLALDQENGSEDRIQMRENRARNDLDRFVSDDPGAWRALATLRPGCPTGRVARLRAAEAYYRAQDLESCLQQLNLLVLREPETDESLVARLRKVEVLREQGQRRKALREIESLQREHGDRVLTRTLGEKTITTTLGERLDTLKDQTESLEVDIRPVPGLPLELAWSSRLELDQLRSTTVHPLFEFPGLENDLRYLVLTLTGARMMESLDGLSLWKFDLEQPPPSVSGGIFLDRNKQSLKLLHLDSQGALLWNKSSIFLLDLESGRLLWRKSPPIVDGVDVSMKSWIHCASAGSTIVAITESHRMLRLNPKSGEVLWAVNLPGLLIDTPTIQADQILCGYSIPDRVEVRDLKSGDLIKGWDLEGEVPGLANAPFFTKDGWIYATEGGSVTKHASDTTILWTQQLPSGLSNLYLAADSTQLIAQHYWTESDPTLWGLSLENGKRLWQKKLPQDSRRVISVKPMGSEVLLVCEGFTNRSLICFKVPGSNPLVNLPEPEQLWKRDLVPAYDAVNLVEHGAWLLVVDRIRGELSILDRFTGTPLLNRNGIEIIPRTTRPLGRMHHAAIIGDHLVTVSARGTVAFRARQPGKSDEVDWSALQQFFATDFSSDRESSATAEQLLEVEISQRESAIQDTQTSLIDKRSASWHLEALERLRGKINKNEVEVPFLPVEPLIDGSLSEPWNTSSGIALEQPRFVRALQGIGEINIPWQDRGDLSGKMFMGWTESGLHIAVEVADDNVTVHDRDSKTWKGDCLLLVLDTLGDGGQTPRSDDQVLTLAFVPPRPQPDPEEEEPEGAEGGEAPPFPEDDEEDEPEGDHVVLRRPDNLGVVYEMTIPWTSILAQRQDFGSNPWPGLKMRIGIAITDDDTGTGATKYLGLTPGMVLHKVMDRLWEGCCPDLLLPIRLVR
ncbi:MAG: hypothetical protein CBC13_05610 [Planctomycetia bacterium TMED53]|nr:MAG: hypothetical protein CBC13_05610 [Planctomycetia bacterium TMED53]